MSRRKCGSESIFLFVVTVLSVPRAFVSINAATAADILYIAPPERQTFSFHLFDPRMWFERGSVFFLTSAVV